MQNNVRARRKDLGMSIPRLSELSGVSCGHISDIERGKKQPGVAIASKLAEALGVRVEDLFPTRAAAKT